MLIMCVVNVAGRRSVSKKETLQNSHYRSLSKAVGTGAEKME